MKIEIRDCKNPDTNEDQRALFFDENMFDWGLDPDQFKEAVLQCQRNRHFVKSVHGSIKKFFLECFSEVVGREITLTEVLKAIEKGEIECT